MKPYLVEFNDHLKAEWAGSLVKVDRIRKPHAKEYMSSLAKEGSIERVVWGWYWVPSKIDDVQEFLRKDRNFKVVAGQTAASIWNHDFIHRDFYIVKVKDRSLARAIEEFGKKKGWHLRAIYTEEQLKYVNMAGLHVEKMEQAIVDSLRNFAFEDAFAAIYVNRDKIKIAEMKRNHYWDRLPRSNIRIGQILEYGWSRITGRQTREIKDSFVRRSIDDALDKVIEIG